MKDVNVLGVLTLGHIHTSHTHTHTPVSLTPLGQYGLYRPPPPGFAPRAGAGDQACTVEISVSRLASPWAGLSDCSSITTSAV